MDKFEKCKLVMLPTNQKATIVDNTYIDIEKHKSNKYNTIYDLGLTKSTVEEIESRGYKFQYIYVLSNDKICDGDHFIKMNESRRKPMLMKERKLGFMNSDWLNSSDVVDCFKVIASDNPSLNLPEPSISFIKKFCKSNATIKEALVEYATYWDTETNGLESTDPEILSFTSPKVSDNNTITIKKIKNVFTREEVDQYLDDVMNLGMALRQDQLNGHCNKSGKEMLTEYKAENLI